MYSPEKLDVLMFEMEFLSFSQIIKSTSKVYQTVMTKLANVNLSLILAIFINALLIFFVTTTPITVDGSFPKDGYEYSP